MKDKPKRKRGRPFGTTKPAAEKSARFELVLKNPAQKEELKRRGGSRWVQAQLEKPERT